MPKILEQLKGETYLRHPEGRGIFCFADDGLIYLVVSGHASYYIERLQPIRKGLSFLELVVWEQFVRTGHRIAFGPRGGAATFRSAKKAIDAIESNKLDWVSDPSLTESARHAAYAERSAEDYLFSKLRWALSKDKGETWACQKAGVTSLKQPWKSQVCELLPLRPRD